jgi:hypothetical protein
VNLEVISSAGDYFAPEGSNITLSWTLGEPVIETFAPTGGSVILTQGFQQPIEATQPGKYTISGYVTYDNNAVTPITNTEIVLIDSELNETGSVFTDASGYYVFNNVDNGTYTLALKITKNWGGGRPDDALLANKCFIGIYTPKDNLTKLAANVDNKGGITPTDALFINRRFVLLITKFSIPDWIYETPTVTVAGANALQNIKVVCAGDINTSYNPPLKKTTQDVVLQNKGYILVKPGQEFDMPINVSRDIKLGAFGLVIKYPSKQVIVKEVISTAPEFIYNIVGDEIRVAWSDAKNAGLELKQDNSLITLRLAASNINNDKEIQLSFDPETMLSDKEAIELKGEILYSPKLAFESSTDGFYLGQNYPNPTRNLTQIDYRLPEAANVSLKLYNLIGEQIGVIEDTRREAGFHQAIFNASGLAEGIYMYRIDVKGVNKEFSKTRMMIISQ